jgi:hypothetical protein
MRCIGSTNLFTPVNNFPGPQLAVFVPFVIFCSNRMLPPPKRIPPLGPPRLSPRQRALAAWRGIDLSAAEKTQNNRTTKVESVMPRVLANLRIDSRRSEAEIVKVWNELIDPNIVAHAQPVGLRKGTLFVTVDSSVWLSEIVRYRRKEILDRLQHSFGRETVARIAFRVG